LLSTPAQKGDEKGNERKRKGKQTRGREREREREKTSLTQGRV